MIKKKFHNLKWNRKFFNNGHLYLKDENIFFQSGGKLNSTNLDNDNLAWFAKEAKVMPTVRTWIFAAITGFILTGIMITAFLAF